MGLGNPDEPPRAPARPAAAAEGAAAPSRAYWAAPAGAVPKSGIGPRGSGAAAGAFLETASGSGALEPNLVRQP